MNALTDIQSDTAQTSLVQTDLGRLNVVARGHGDETIALWPSIFTDHHIYDALTDLLGDRYRFLLIDGPAHGASEGTGAEVSMADCGRAFLTVLDHFGIRHAVIGGTSWGGLAAAEAALAAPDRIKALILLNTPMQIDGAAPGLSARMISAGARWAVNRTIFQNGIARSFFSDDRLQANPVYKRHFHAMLTSADPKAMGAVIRSVILRGTPLKLRLSGLGMPVLVIAGKTDAMYPIHAQAEAALLAPKGDFAPVTGKHISVVEAPQDVAANIDRFMDSLESQ